MQIIQIRSGTETEKTKTLDLALPAFSCDSAPDLLLHDFARALNARAGPIILCSGFHQRPRIRTASRRIASQSRRKFTARAFSPAIRDRVMSGRHHGKHDDVVRDAAYRIRARESRVGIFLSARYRHPLPQTFVK